jgi:hypothetical protein
MNKNRVESRIKVLVDFKKYKIYFGMGNGVDTEL